MGYWNAGDQDEAPRSYMSGVKRTVRVVPVAAEIHEAASLVDGRVFLWEGKPAIQKEVGFALLRLWPTLDETTMPIVQQWEGEDVAASMRGLAADLADLLG